jgi:hypothetical protein
MKIVTMGQKEVLLSLFYTEKQTMQGTTMISKEFPLEDLMSAGSAKKKLMPKIKDNKAFWEEKEIEFTPSEIVVLKKLFDEKKTWSVDAATIVQELKNIFNPA